MFKFHWFIPHLMREESESFILSLLCPNLWLNISYLIFFIDFIHSNFVNYWEFKNLVNLIMIIFLNHFSSNLNSLNPNMLEYHMLHSIPILNWSIRQLSWGIQKKTSFHQFFLLNLQCTNLKIHFSKSKHQFYFSSQIINNFYWVALRLSLHIRDPLSIFYS